MYCIVHGMFVDEVNCYFTLLTSNYSMPCTTSLTQQVGGMNRRKTSKGSWDSLESQILTLRKMDWSFTEAKTLLTWRIHCQIHQLKKIRWHLQTAKSKARSALSTEKKQRLCKIPGGKPQPRDWRAISIFLRPNSRSSKEMQILWWRRHNQRSSD